jgi:GAF domain-containing protein
VQQRTSEVERRMRELETASRIARDISTIQEMDLLLQSSVDLIQHEYGLYYAAIFLVDDSREYAVLESGTGEAGKTMRALNHRLKLDESSFVGYAVVRQQVRLSQNVAGDVVHYKNPHLPETQSELAIPLVVNQTAIGVLNVQSTQAEYFSPNDIHALQITADQLAVAIEKAILVRKLSQTLADLREGYRQATEQTWSSFLRSVKRNYAYRIEKGVIETGQIVVQPAYGKDGHPGTAVSVPITLRSQVIGVLDFHFEGERLQKDVIDLLQAASNRLATSLENARLLEEIQLKAARDRMISNITSKVRSESSIDRVLQTVAAELGHSMGVTDVLVQLRGVD